MKLRRAAILRERTGLTLIELLVATLVLTVGILAVISVFFAAGRMGRGAVRRLEAVRLSRAVAGYMEQQSNLQVFVGSPLRSESASLTPLDSPMKLVWQCDVQEHPESDAADRLYRLTITVSADVDADGQFDPVIDLPPPDLDLDDDPVVATFMTLLAAP